MAPKKLVFTENEGAPEQTADQKPSEEEDSGSNGEEERGKVLEKPIPGENRSAKPKPTGTAGKVFPDEDVIGLLKGLAVFWANGRYHDWAGFHKFIKDNVNLTKQYTKTQLSEKIRTLEKKFHRDRANGSGSNESAVFQLSKAIWGDDRTGDEHEKSRKRKQLDDEDDDDGGKKKISKQDFESAFPLVYAELVRMGYSEYVKGIPWEKAAELEEKWREVNAQSLRLHLKKLELLQRDLQDRLQSK